MIIFFAIIIFSTINLYFNAKIKFYFYIKSIFIDTFTKFWYSLVYFSLFIIFFVIFIRIIRIFLIKNSYVDSNLILKFLLKLISIYGIEFSTFCVIFIIFLFFNLRKILVFFSKFHLLRIFFLYRKIFIPYVYYPREFETKQYRKISKFKEKFLRYFFKNCFKFVLIYFFFKGYFIDNGVIYIGFLPWYALYYFIYNILDFFKKLNWEFDFVTHFIYKGLNITTDCFFKLKEYHNYLIIGYSEYDFLNSVDILFKKLNEKTLTLEKDKDYFIE